MIMDTCTDRARRGITPRRKTQGIVGQRIREYRAMRHMSQARLATASGLDSTLISRFESGDRDVSPDALEAIVDALHLTHRQAYRLFVHAFVPKRFHDGEV